MLLPQFVAGEHGLFGGHESEDISTIFLKQQLHKYISLDNGLYHDFYLTIQPIFMIVWATGNWTMAMNCHITIDI